MNKIETVWKSDDTPTAGQRQANAGPTASIQVGAKNKNPEKCSICDKQASKMLRKTPFCWRCYAEDLQKRKIRIQEMRLLALANERCVICEEQASTCIGGKFYCEFCSKPEELERTKQIRDEREKNDQERKIKAILRLIRS